jgi:hypothetical protein
VSRSKQRNDMMVEQMKTQEEQHRKEREELQAKLSESIGPKVPMRNEC